MTKESKDGTLYLIVPAKNEDGPRQTQDEAVENEGLQDWARDSWRAFTGGRKQVPVTPQQVTNQIMNYVTVVREVAASESAKTGTIQLSEITLSLTLSASGNIGLASTSAEAGISLVFKRQ